MRSAQLADAAGVHVETSRSYERRGLLPAPPRRASGYRDYPPEATQQLRLIKQAQVLGLRLEDIAEPLALNPHAGIAYGDFETRIRSTLSELDTKLVALTDLRGSLERLLCECGDGHHTTQISRALERHPA